MHIHTVLVSYKRRELTEKALQAYLDTVSVPHSLIIVDNGSPPETTDWLVSLDVATLFLDKNYFPGYATNRGWERMPQETSLLHRLDNDIQLLPGWCENAIDAFKDSKVGQYGLLGLGDKEWLRDNGLYPAEVPSWPCGGNSIIHRKVYEGGLRYSERPWYEGGILEDHQMTLDVWRMGYTRVFASDVVMEYMSGRDEEYDKEIKKLKGL